MFTKEQEEYIIGRLRRNDVILFVGAGFPTGASNRLGEPLPTGYQLAEKIWKFLGYEEPYDNTALKLMYEALITSGIKKSEIINFLRDVFAVRSYPETYSNLTIPFWHKIYTTNIDDLIQNIYKDYSDQRIDTLFYPKHEYKERDFTLQTLQLIHINGKVNNDQKFEPDTDLIFSRAQYARGTLLHQPLYSQFVNDYSVLPTIFIGTSIDEPIFEQYIAAREARRGNISEQRPKSFLIDPVIPPVKEKILKDSFNIESIKASVDDFLDWIGSISDQLYSREDTLKVVAPTLAANLNQAKTGARFREAIADFSGGFEKVNTEKKPNSKKSKAFLMGTTPTWTDIKNNLDAERKVTKSIFEEVISHHVNHKELKIFALLGSAGCGKSTILKRLSYNLVQNGKTVFFSTSEYLPDIDNICTFLDINTERTILVFDNAELMLNQFAKLASKLESCKKPPVVIIAARTNIFDRLSGRLEPIENITEFKVPHLVRDEIVALLNILDDNNLLSYLKGLPVEQRIKEFEQKARKQILVAMKFATKGEDFDLIIKSEFDEIEPKEAKLLCLCVALTTDAGFTISKQDFVGFSHASPADALHYLERNLKDIVLKVGIKEDRLMLRHRTIAEFMITNCANPTLLKDAFLRVLSVLAYELNSPDRNTRKFSLYREIINHHMVYQRFKMNIELARDVYESLIDYFNNDFHFWLQYGCLELEGKGGSVELADNYLNQAYSLNKKNFYVKNALGNLYYRKSIIASNVGESQKNKEAADEILLQLINDDKVEDAHTYHIYCRGYYEWIRKWVLDKQVRAEYLNELLKVLREGSKRHPLNAKLKKMQEKVHTAYLYTVAVDKDEELPNLGIE